MKHHNPDRLTPDERAWVEANLARVGQLTPDELARLNIILGPVTRAAVVRRGRHEGIKRRERERLRV
jgi:hypothetical protein